MSQLAGIAFDTRLLPPRFLLASTRVGRAGVDGGWWPRSWNPEAELSGLALSLALASPFGPIRNVMLNNVAWDHRIRRMPVGDDVVRIVWSADIDPSLLTATTGRGERLDLLVVPHLTAAAAAGRAMAMAGDPGNIRGASAILAAATAAPDAVRNTNDRRDAGP